MCLKLRIFFILEEIQSKNGVGITSIRFYGGINSDVILDTDTKKCLLAFPVKEKV